MAVIPHLITAQAFEIVRDRIGAILADELESQVTAYGNYYAEVTDVWVERFIKIDKTEVPCINVTLAQGELNAQSQLQSDGIYTFNVDCYHGSPATDTEDGDTLAMVKLQRLLGICRAILEDSRYKTLGFAAPFVMNRHVSNVGVATPGKEDADNTVFGRLQVVVRVPENTDALTPALLAAYETQVKLALTDKGYRYEVVV
jgi:hypothetical protein